MSAAALAEYLIFRADQQETVLHNSRFASPPVVVAHSDAMTAIRAYNTDPNRSKASLDMVKNSLKVRSADLSIRPKAREEALRCLETIDLFELAENALGLRPLRIEEAQRFALMDINGLLLSVQADLIVRGPSIQVGAVMFRPQKAPDPESCRLEETRRQRGEHRREMARYMLTMMQMAFEKQGAHLGTFERDLTFVADIRLGERIPFPTEDYASRVRAIMAAGKQIERQWDDIEPRKSVLAKD
jgi:hypothetical protein